MTATDKKTYPGQKPKWCVHFRSMGQYDTCRAGVSYDTPIYKPFTRAACFLDEEGNSKPGSMPCEKLRRPTQEEITQYREWFNQRLAKHAMVGPAVIAWRARNAGKSIREVIECPACGGRLHLSMAACNGHVHGRCETDGCVSWME